MRNFAPLCVEYKEKEKERMTTQISKALFFQKFEKSFLRKQKRELPEFGSFTIINVKTRNQIIDSVIGTLAPDLIYQPENTLVSVFERRRRRKRIVEVRQNEGEEIPPGNEYKKYTSLIDLFPP